MINSVGCSRLGLLLSVLLFIVVALHHDQIVVLVRGDHHVMDLAGDAEESQIVLGIQVANEASCRDGQFRQPDGVLRSLFTLTHRGSDNLWLVALLHLSLLDDDEALDTLVLLDARDTILNFRLQLYLKSQEGPAFFHLPTLFYLY